MCPRPGDLWNSIGLTARDANRYIRLIEQRGPSSGHPFLASMPETRYFKCCIGQAF